MAELTPLYEKLGEAFGLAKAARTPRPKWPRWKARRTSKTTQQQHFDEVRSASLQLAEREARG